MRVLLAAGIVMVASTLSALVGCGSASSSSVAEGTGGGGSASSSAGGSGDTLSVIQTGYGSTSTGTTVIVARVQNNTASDAATGITYQFTVYGPDNQVVGTGSLNLPIVRAGEATAVATPVSVPKGTAIDHVKVQVAVQSWEKDPHPASVITSRGVQFVPSNLNPTVNGELVSHYQQNVSHVRASAVCYGYDTSHDILGGGFSYVDILPGGGTAEASISVDLSTGPKSCELYATLSNLTQGS